MGTGAFPEGTLLEFEIQLAQRCGKGIQSVSDKALRMCIPDLLKQEELRVCWYWYLRSLPAQTKLVVEPVKNGLDIHYSKTIKLPNDCKAVSCSILLLSIEMRRVKRDLCAIKCL